MRQSGRTTLFVLICIAVLTAAYGVGLGVRKMREAGIKIHISMGDDTKKPADKPEPTPKAEPSKVVAFTETPPEEELAEEPAEEPSEEPQEEFAAQAERPDVVAKKEQFQKLPEEEKRKILAQKRKYAEEKGRAEGRGGRGGFQQLSEEARDDFRTKMEALGAQAEAGEISEEEMRQARGELLQEYGMNVRGRGGRRAGGRQ